MEHSGLEVVKQAHADGNAVVTVLVYTFASVKAVPTDSTGSFRWSRGGHMYHSILIPIDGSPESDAALEHAENLARGLETELILLYVVPSLSIPDEHVIGAYVGLDLDIATRELHRQGEVVIARAIERLRDQTLEGFLHPRTRCLIYDAEGYRVADVILRVAHDEHVDLIVLGAHGHSAKPDHSQALLGHVAERVAHLSSLPLLLVRAAV
jgi:nucleotide-binding universal stress UspA family protein